MRKILLLTVLLQMGCATVRGYCYPRFCLDGASPKLILDANCLHGICGYSCAPDRWKGNP